MKHLFFIDNLSNLNTKKDSSLMLALSFKEAGHDVFLLFEEDFYVSDQGLPSFLVYDFQGNFDQNGYHLAKFQQSRAATLELKEGDILHMRLDPPFDARYLKYLWMLDYLQSFGVRVLNNPRGIMFHNEKIHALKCTEKKIPTYIGSSNMKFKDFLDELRIKKFREVILKPLDLFCGIGIQKVDINDENLMEYFKKKVSEQEGAIMVQPFIEQVYQGEYRALFFNGEEMGSILKKPKEGSFLSNIAQGAQFQAVSLPHNIKKECENIAWELKEHDVPLVAFDILGDSITEVNVTCPGLIVEVSAANERNIAKLIVKSFS